MKKLRIGLKYFLSTRRTLGVKDFGTERLLLDFVLFLERKKANQITSRHALLWAKAPVNSTPHYWISRLSKVRCFAKFMKTIDRKTEIPPLNLIPDTRRRPTPYIYGKHEIQELISSAQKLYPQRHLLGMTYSTIFGLLWTSGLRISEVLNLNKDDIDFENTALRILRTKFGKSRIVPLHPTVLNILKNYTKERDKVFKNPKTTSFFVTIFGTRPTHAAVDITFIKLSKQIGIRSKKAKSGPRLHDFRHSFAVRSLIRLYKKNQNVEKHLHSLAVYLGHTNIKSTYWYLTAVPELMSIAQERVEKQIGGLP